MSPAELAAKLDGRPYGEEITDDECAAAKAAGLVVVFGYGDDNAEFRGAIGDEVPCYDDGEILLVGGRIWGSGDDECEAGEHCRCPHHARARADAVERGKTIKAAWCAAPGSPDWTYETDIPHATFDVMDEGEVYCRGIVFALADAS